MVHWVNARMSTRKLGELIGYGPAWPTSRQVCLLPYHMLQKRQRHLGADRILVSNFSFR